MVIWLIGMSGAGKTAIGKELYKLIKSKKNNVVFIDGDIIREILGNDVGHTIEDRKINAGRVCRICKYLDSQGIDVVCGILSIFPESQDWNRKNIENYFEVYVKVPFEELVRRDSKDLYKNALNGKIKDVVGVDIDFPEPLSPNLVIENNNFDTTVANHAVTIFNHISKMLI